jgi:hypothetical protein
MKINGPRVIFHHEMKAILIDPAARSVGYIETDLELAELHGIIEKDGLSFCRPFPEHRLEVAIVGDHSAMQTPALARFFVEGYGHPLYGKTVVYGVSSDGKDRSTSLSVEQVRSLIEFE